jgi:hypothetical protein
VLSPDWYLVPRTSCVLSRDGHLLPPDGGLNKELAPECLWLRRRGGVIIDGPLRVDNEFERRLSVGAMIACRLRGAVRERLGVSPSPSAFCPSTVERAVLSLFHLAVPGHPAALLSPLVPQHLGVLFSPRHPAGLQFSTVHGLPSRKHYFACLCGSFGRRRGMVSQGDGRPVGTTTTSQHSIPVDGLQYKLCESVPAC